MDVLITVISMTASIISGMTLFLLQRYFRKVEQKKEKFQENAVKESALIIKSIRSIGKLCQSTAEGLVEGKMRGDVHSALKDYIEIDRELFEFLLNR